MERPVVSFGINDIIEGCKSIYYILGETIERNDVQPFDVEGNAEAIISYTENAMKKKEKLQKK